MYSGMILGTLDDFHDAVRINAYCLHTRSLNGRVDTPAVLSFEPLKKETIVFQRTFQRPISVGFGACSAVFIGMLREHALYIDRQYRYLYLTNSIKMIAPGQVTPARVLCVLSRKYLECSCFYRVNHYWCRFAWVYEYITILCEYTHNIYEFYTHNSIRTNNDIDSSNI